MRRKTLKKMTKPLTFTVTDVDRIQYKDGLFIVKCAFYNIVIEISPYVVARIVKYAKTIGYKYEKGNIISYREDVEDKQYAKISS